MNSAEKAHKKRLMEAILDSAIGKPSTWPLWMKNGIFNKHHLNSRERFKYWTYTVGNAIEPKIAREFYFTFAERSADSVKHFYYMEKQYRQGKPFTYYDIYTKTIQEVFVPDHYGGWMKDYKG